MGKKSIKTIKDATRALGVKDVSEIQEGHAVKFIELLPKMDKDIALQLLNLCPTLIQITPEVLQAFERISENAMQSESPSNTAVMSAYQTILDTCKKAMEDNQLSFEEKEILLNKMIEIADKMDAKDREHKQWLKDIHDKTAKYGLAALGAVLGIVTIVAIDHNKQEK